MYSDSPIQNKKEVAKFVAILFIVVLAFGGGVIVGGGLKTQSGGVITSTNGFDATYLQSLYDRVQKDYLGTIPSSNDITYGMAKGLVASLGDQYTAYLNPTEAQGYLQSQDSAYEGIGVQLGFNGQYTSVDTILDGFPAQQTGLKSGDLILKVDGQDMANVRPEIVSTKIKGKAGTTVDLNIYRESSQEVLDFTLTRQAINLDNVTYDDLGNGVFKINIVKFTEGADGDSTGVQVFNRHWSEIVNQVAAKNPKAVIVDLRNNPGGYVDSVRYVAEEFLHTGKTIMFEEEKDQPKVEFTDNRTGKFESIPMAVLVNEGSASASEIFAAAMQDNSRGSVIGQKTIGKGVEQKIETLDDNALLVLVFQHWITPAGHQISKDSPITPDFIIDYKAATNGSKLDTQVQKALDSIAK